MCQVGCTVVRAAEHDWLNPSFVAPPTPKKVKRDYSVLSGIFVVRVAYSVCTLSNV